MESRPVVGPARPQSIKELVEQAENFTFNANIAMRYWARAADALYQEASFALADGDYGRAYMMLYRHSVLVLKFLPTHPQFKEPESKKLFKPLSKRIDRVLEDLEQLKPEIERAYKEWEHEAPPPAADHKRQTTAPSAYADFAARDPSLSGNAKVLDAAEHQELAVDLAQQEISRRERDKRAHRHGGMRQDHDTTLHGSQIPQNKYNAPSMDDVDLQRQMEATRRTLDMAGEARNRGALVQDMNMPFQALSNQYYYPSLSKSRPIEYEQSSRLPSAHHHPDRPPKERFEALQPHDDGFRNTETPFAPPLRPQKEYLDDRLPEFTSQAHITANQPPLPPKSNNLQPPPPKKERLAFKPGGYLENGDPIRSIFIPSNLRRKFLEIASKNTAAGLETCGILCGTPINNALFVRCLLIPDQKSTSDTCETENESSLFDYCMSEDLLMLGWIHTHPTQTCFMSSRDLHTHAGYQVMMPESIAIVCAPKYNPSYGIFRLTHPPGLDHILNCSRTETFHQHNIDNLYREADYPHGHVYESDKMPLQVVDLRTK